ncbi:MAG TPA: hypothetical protein VHY58_24500 [Streptosporangiaceae bacterium]|jgi:hypothetical protein|nr:hypothetical protein [Streptosporangiaceae bacterium]
MGSYEERYRLTGPAVLGLAASILAIALGFALGLPAILLPIGIVLVALTAQGAGLGDLARRTVAFRADNDGITLGVVPDKLTVRRGSTLFIPWADAEAIVIYRVYAGGRGRHAPVECVGIQRYASAEPLLWGNEQSPGCPVPRVATWATRRITGWRLDRDQLAAFVGEAAPKVLIVDTTATTDNDPF